MPLKKSLYLFCKGHKNDYASQLTRRLENSLSDSWDISHVKPGDEFNKTAIRGASGPSWWQARSYSKSIDALLQKQKPDATISIERGTSGDIHCVTDGRFDKWLEYQLESSPFQIFSPWHSIAPRLENKSITSAKTVVACSEMVMSDLEQHYPEQRHKFKVIYNGFDASEYKVAESSKQSIRETLNFPADGWMILFISERWEHDGLEETLRFASVAKNILKDPSKTPFVVVVGEGREKHHSLIKRLGLSGRVHFIPHADIRHPLYQAANVFVLPTLYDPFSNHCLEALACGCPVVTTEHNGAAEIISHAETGYIIETGNTDIRRKAVSWCLRLHSSPEAIANTVNHLTNEKEAEQYEQILNDIPTAH